MKPTLCLTAFLAASSFALAEPPQYAEAEPAVLAELQEAVDTGLSLKEMQQVATKHHAHEILILRPSKTETNDWVLMEGIALGIERSAGDMLTVYDDIELRQGMWFFQGGGTISHTNGYTITLDQSTLVIAGSENISVPIEKQFVSGGSVECGDGFYACCGTNQHGQWRAKCIQNGNNTPGGANFPVECTNGGPGATGCSNGDGAFLIYEP